MTAADTCPSCGHPRPDRYCSNWRASGAWPLDDLTFSQFLRSLAEDFVPALDGADDQPFKRAGDRLYRTAYTLLGRPSRGERSLRSG